MAGATAEYPIELSSDRESNYEAGWTDDSLDSTRGISMSRRCLATHRMIFIERALQGQRLRVRSSFSVRRDFDEKVTWSTDECVVQESHKQLPTPSTDIEMSDGQPRGSERKRKRVGNAATEKRSETSPKRQRVIVIPKKPHARESTGGKAEEGEAQRVLSVRTGALSISEQEHPKIPKKDAARGENLQLGAGSRGGGPRVRPQSVPAAKRRHSKSMKVARRNSAL